MNNKTTLLIVEDDKAIVHFISSILSVNEYRTLYAGTGREAIALIASYRPDVVLLDLGLPDIDGLDVLKTVRQWSEVPIADYRCVRARAGTGKGAGAGSWGG